MQAGISPLIKTLYVRCKSSPRESSARSRLADVRAADYLTKNEKAPRLVEKSLGELHIMGRKNWRVQKMGYTKMNRHNYPDIEGLTEAERAKLDHIEDIEDDLADAYDSTATYAVGDWCIRNGKLYECITAIATAEPFDSTKWRRVAVAELKSNLTDKDLVLIATKTGLSSSPTNYTYESDADDVDQYKELIMVIAWNANQVNYRISVAMPTVALIDDYPTPYLLANMNTMNAYCKFDTKRSGTIHWINPPSGTTASRFDLYARK